MVISNIFEGYASEWGGQGTFFATLKVRHGGAKPRSCLCRLVERSRGAGKGLGRSGGLS